MADGGHTQRLLGIMAASWADLRAAVDAVRGRLDAPATELGAPENGVGWSVLDAIAHVAVWERMAARSIAEIPLPEGEEIAARTPWNLDRFNDAMVLKWRGRPAGDVFAELDAAHAALVDAVGAADEGDCAEGGRVWAKIRDDGAGHYPYHVAVKNRFG